MFFKIPNVGTMEVRFSQEKTLTLDVTGSGPV